MKAIKIIFILFLIIAIFCILFIRVVPDYSNKFGFEIVSIDDYKKQKEGYCLKEDRIFSEDEIYRRAVKSYLLTIREEAEYPKYYNYMDEKYSYWDICTGGHCNFYKFDVKNLDELNQLIVSAGIMEMSHFIEKYGVKFEPKNSEILDKNGNLMHTIIFDNSKSMVWRVYFPDSFFIVIQDKMKSNLAFLTLDWNMGKKFPTSFEYSKYYLAVKYYSKISGNKISTFKKSNAYDYYPITTCGEIKFSDIFDKPGGRKYIFSASDNIFDR